MSDGLEDKLDQGLAALNLALSQTQTRLMLAYLHLLNKWNRTYNLSAVREIDKMLSRHLLDSISVHSYVRGHNILDVGSGGGLPGIPLAITFPDRQFTLIDSNGKKTRFLFQVVTELGLKNVTVEQCRVEDKQPPPRFDGIVSRAFSTINAMLDGCSQLLAEGGILYAMKGRYPTAELEQLAAGFHLETVHRLTVPNNQSDRHLVILNRR